MNIKDPLQVENFEIKEAWITPHTSKAKRVAIDTSAIKQFEYTEGLMQKFHQVT